MSTLLDQFDRRAIKRHQCGDCLGWITRGDRYVEQRVAYDGRAYTHRAHALCHALYVDAYWEWSLADDEWGVESAREVLDEWWKVFVAIFAPAPKGDEA